MAEYQDQESDARDAGPFTRASQERQFIGGGTLYPSQPNPGTTAWNVPPPNLSKSFDPGCFGDTHRFACKHEVRCLCGQTYRTSVYTVPAGL